MYVMSSKTADGNARQVGGMCCTLQLTFAQGMQCSGFTGNRKDVNGNLCSIFSDKIYRCCEIELIGDNGKTNRVKIVKRDTLRP